MHWQCSVKSIQELLQQRWDGITKNLSREYETMKDVPPDSQLLFGNDLNNRIKLLQASNKACKVNITPNNSRYYQTYSPNFSQNQDKFKLKKVQGLLEKNLCKNSFWEEATTGVGKQTQVPAQELKNQVRDIHMKLNNVIKTYK